MNSIPDSPAPVKPVTYLALCGTDVIAFGERLADVLANARACLEGESDVVLWCDAPGGVTALALLRKDGELVSLTSRALAG